MSCPFNYNSYCYKYSKGIFIVSHIMLVHYFLKRLISKLDRKEHSTQRKGFLITVWTAYRTQIVLYRHTQIHIIHYTFTCQKLLISKTYYTVWTAQTRLFAGNAPYNALISCHRFSTHHEFVRLLAVLVVLFHTHVTVVVELHTDF